MHTNMNKIIRIFKGFMITAAVLCIGPGALYAYNQAIYLNGTNNYIEIPHDDDFNLVGDIAIELWIKVDAFETPYATLVTKGASSWAVRRYKDTDFIQFIYGEDSIAGTTGVNDGRWHHIAATFSFAKILRLYIDGELDAEKINTLPGFPANTNPVCIGTDPEQPERLFHGIVDEVRIYHITQSPDNIRQYMNVELTDLDPRMIAYYRMNNDYYNPSHIIDYTGNGHTGILQHTYGSAFVYSGVIFASPPKSGDGTVENPYTIDSIGYLFWISQDTARWHNHYLQTADIDASATASLYGGRGFSPIGSHNVAFSGTYQGADHAIDGLYISRPEEDTVGLFGNTGSTVLRNIILTAADITGGDFVGGVAAVLDDHSEMERCAFSGSLTGLAGAGAMAGATGDSSLIIDCINTATVSGEDNVGGVVGANSSASRMIRCCNQGAVSGTGSQCGGVAGYNQQGSYLINCYSTGPVSGNIAAGGLLGDNSAFVESCYSAGAVTAATSPGGLVGGTGPGTVSNSFWDTGTSGQDNSNGGTGRSSAEMKDAGTYTIEDGTTLITAWDFVTNPNDDDAIMGIWNLDATAGINSGYPFLSWQAPLATEPTGTGIVSDPYLVTNLNHLVWMTENAAAWESYFEQAADIDAWETWGWNNRLGFMPIGTDATAFAGTYHGGGYAIDSLLIRRGSEDNTGLFGKTDGAHISGLRLTHADITGSTYTGVLAGYASGSDISNCGATGIVRGPQEAGGLLGYTTVSSIQNCYAEVDVEIPADGSLPQRAGGLIGYCNASSMVSNCYARGKVYGEYASGGLIGDLENSSVENSYSTGLVSTSGYAMGGLIGLNAGGSVDHAFWDMETSGHTSSAGGDGKSTMEMLRATTFLNAGWDFSLSGDTWAMNPEVNDGYPFLRMQGDVTAYIWLGTSGTSWAASGNWSEDATPPPERHVIIPGAANDPVIGSSTGANANRLIIEPAATLRILSGGSLITTGTITNNGNVDVSMDVASGQWNLISAPVSSATANLFYGDYLQHWDETSAMWFDITDENTPLTCMKGYSLWPISEKSTFTFSGTPNTGDQDTDITFTEAAGNENDGANLVGNPYPSYLDWDQVTGYGAKYTWNGTAYDAYTQTGGYGTGSRYVAPMEGFFVVVESAGTFSLTDAMRTHQPPTKNDGEKNLQKGLILAATNGSYNDRLWIVLDENKTENFELECDAWKLLSNTEGLSQIWSVSPDGKLAVDVRPETETVRLGFANDQAGIYSIALKQIAGINTAILEDTKNAIFHDLTKGAYEFTWEITDDEQRYKLHLNAVGIEENRISESDILVYTANRQIFIKGATEGKVLLSDLTGRVVLRQEISDESLTIIPVNYKTGVYIVTVENGKEVKTEKVFIK